MAVERKYSATKKNVKEVKVVGTWLFYALWIDPCLWSRLIISVATYCTQSNCAHHFPGKKFAMFIMWEKGSEGKYLEACMSSLWLSLIIANILFPFLTLKSAYHEHVKLLLFSSSCSIHCKNPEILQNKCVKTLY